MECRICGNLNLELILDLGSQPPSDAFLDNLNEPETTYPLELYKCNVCGLYQLGYVVPPHILYQNSYPYRTGDNKEGVKHFNKLAEKVFKKYLKKGSHVVDIGGNDGTLLKAFQDLGCGVLNIDPSGVDCCVPCVKAFYTEKFAKRSLLKSCSSAVVATNVFAHCNDLHEFMRGVSHSLKQDGVFVVEMPDCDVMLDKLEYDTIYHEHLSYFNEKSMKYLMDMHNMKIINIERYEIHGGTNRYYIQRKSKTEQKEAA